MWLGHAEAKGSWLWGSDDEESSLTLTHEETWLTGEGCMGELRCIELGTAVWRSVRLKQS